MFGKDQCLENAGLSQTAKLSYRGKKSNVTGVNSAAMLSDVKLGLPALSMTVFFCPFCEFVILPECAWYQLTDCIMCLSTFIK